jgi:hypothetical protein
MHGFKEFLVCTKVNCKSCKRYVENRPLPTRAKWKNLYAKTPVEKKYESPFERRAKNAARQREWRHRNKQAVQS